MYVKRSGADARASNTNVIHRDDRYMITGHRKLAQIRSKTSEMPELEFKECRLCLVK